MPESPQRPQPHRSPGHVDLRRASPWLRYPLALSVVVFVVALAVVFGGADQPAPRWITDWLIPVLSIVWSIAAVWRLLRWWRAREPRP